MMLWWRVVYRWHHTFMFGDTPCFSLLASRFSLLASRFSLLALILIFSSTAWVQASGGGNTGGGDKLPALDNAVCSSDKAVSGNVTTYKIKGTGSAINIPAGSTGVTFVVQFQKKVNNVWVDEQSHTINTVAVNGTATFDTGWDVITPAANEIWRFKLDGSYTLNSVSSALTGIVSNELTPK
jgi:hypothetical protein